MTRSIQVIKMRGTKTDSDIRELPFSDQGLYVHTDRKVQSQ